MSVSSTKVLKLTRSVLKGNEQNPAAALETIPAGSHVSLSATMLDVLVHMKHFGQIEIPKYGFTIKDGWLYCQNKICTASNILLVVLDDVPWINGLSVGLLDGYDKTSFIIAFSFSDAPTNHLKHLVIYENIPEYKNGWPPALLRIIRYNIGSLVTFCADEFPRIARVFESLQYLKIRNDYYKRDLKIEYFPKLMVFDVPYIRFPNICVKTMRFETNLPYGHYNCATWGHAMRNLKRHRAAVYTYVKFTPVLSRDVARIIFCMVKAMPSTEWKLNEDDIPSKFKHDTSANSKYIADVSDPEYIEMASNYQDLVRLEQDERFFQREVESLHKKRKAVEEDITNYQDKLDESRIEIQKRTEYVLPLIHQFLK